MTWKHGLLILMLLLLQFHLKNPAIGKVGSLSLKLIRIIKKKNI